MLRRTFESASLSLVTCLVQIPVAFAGSTATYSGTLQCPNLSSIKLTSGSLETQEITPKEVKWIQEQIGRAHV